MPVFVRDFEKQAWSELGGGKGEAVGRGNRWQLCLVLLPPICR